MSIGTSRLDKLSASKKYVSNIVVQITRTAVDVLQADKKNATSFDHE
jgi:hypothetical protein